MVSIFSWIKKEIEYLIKSLPDIMKGFVFFLLGFSGLGCALLLRFFDFNGTFISTLSVLIEIISLLLCYYLFKGSFKVKEEIEQVPSKKGKKR